MDLFLQIWGGGLYLLNKVFFALAEGKSADKKRILRITGWVVYILGLPAWVIILAGKHDWIAASIEAGGLPAMLLGLYNAWRTAAVPDGTLTRVASLATYSALVLGLGYSLYDHGGISAVSQILEMGVMVGFLVGSYLLAGKNPKGWLFFMLMNGSMAALMLIQHKPLLSAQQLVSLLFVIYGFTIALRTDRERG